MHSRYSLLFRGLWFLIGLGALFILVGCDAQGNLTESVDPGTPNPGQNTLSDRNISAVVTERPNINLLQPVERIPRDQFGQVPEGQFVDGNSQPTTLAARSLFFPSINTAELAALAEGITFFTTVHTAAEGLGPVNNQARCLGCHLSSREITPDIAAGTEILTHDTQFSRAARATPTNFRFTSRGLDMDYLSGGRAADHLDAINDTGDTAAFTIFGDFSPSTGAFNSLEDFGGTVQHTRPSIAACAPDAILPLGSDPFLSGGIDPITGLSPVGLRRAVGERAGPPYVGRGLMEAIHPADIIANEDPFDAQGLVQGPFVECPGDCVSGRHNENSLSLPVGGDPVERLSRFGLRGAGPTIFQFVTGGAFGELGFTIPFFPTEPNNPFNVRNPACADRIGDPDLHENVIFACRSFIRMSAPPEFGEDLRRVLDTALEANPPPLSPLEEAVRHGAELFGVDVVAFAECMVAGTGDCRRNHARVNPTARNRSLDCAACHTPVFATGGSPAEVGGRHLSHKWIHLFSDLLIHDMGEVTGERIAPTPRIPVPSSQLRNGDLRPNPNAFDLSRNLADDALPGQGRANGREWRTPPLWGMGKTSPPFLHDARVYLSGLTADTTPAGTVYSYGDGNDITVVNAPLVVLTQDDAIRAAIELHDLPAPDGENTAPDGGCPVPDHPMAAETPIIYATEVDGSSGICPGYNTATSRRNRSEARDVIWRYRRLTPADQQALIEFLKQL